MTEDEARQRVIRAMCPERVCRTCGEPSRRILGEVAYQPSTHYTGERRRKPPLGGGNFKPNKEGLAPAYASFQNKGSVIRTTPTLGWTDCGHDDWRPGVWIDPFQKTEEVMLTLGNIDQ